MPEQTVRILGKDWFPTINRTMSFWHQCLSVDGQCNNTKDFEVKAKLNQLAISVDAIHTDILHYHENEDIYNKAIFDYLSSKDRLTSFKGKYKKFAKELLNSLDKCNKSLNVKNLEDFFSKYTRFCAGLHLTASIGRQGSLLLCEELRKKGIDEDDIPKIVSSITYPKQHTPLFNSQLDMLKIGKDIQKKKPNQKQIDSRLKAWLKDYSHIPVNFCGNPWSLEDSRKQLSNALKKDCTKEILSLEKIHKEKIKHSRSLLKSLKSQRINLLSLILSECTILNEFRKNTFSKVSLEFRPIFAKIVKMSSSSDWRDCFYLKPEEMLGILEGKKINIVRIKEERRVAGITIGKDNKIVYLNKEDCQKCIDFLNELHGKSKNAPPTTETFVKGFPANKGLVRGKAKVILSPKDFSKLEKGDILITTMTSVDFIPLMQKAAAFVTNEGGIASHASIVSREMGKPCIIGTKIATKVFKDGDLVEVDADKGVVRKVN